MTTFIYMIRHGESPKTEGSERTRGLTNKGRADADKITNLLRNEGIDQFISSPYTRAVLTIEELAKTFGKEVIVFEDLKEMIFSNEDKIIPDHQLYPSLDKIFSDPNFSLPGGESSANCQKRSIKILKEILNEYSGQKVVIGTHGIVMTLMMGFFDRQYGLDFLLHTSKPDIYRMEFNEEELIETKRLRSMQEG